jgi:hypothetical protein
MQAFLHHCQGARERGREGGQEGWGGGLAFPLGGEDNEGARQGWSLEARQGSRMLPATQAGLCVVTKASCPRTTTATTGTCATKNKLGV